MVFSSVCFLVGAEIEVSRLDFITLWFTLLGGGNRRFVRLNRMLLGRRYRADGTRSIRAEGKGERGSILCLCLAARFAGVIADIGAGFTRVLGVARSKAFERVVNEFLFDVATIVTDATPAAHTHRTVGF